MRDDLLLRLPEASAICPITVGHSWMTVDCYGYRNRGYKERRRTNKQSELVVFAHVLKEERRILTDICTPLHALLQGKFAIVRSALQVSWITISVQDYKTSANSGVEIFDSTLLRNVDCV